MTQRRLVAVALVAVLSGATAACVPRRPAAATAARIKALEDLRDAGVITPAEYAARAATLEATPDMEMLAKAAVPEGGAEQHQIFDQQLAMPAAQVETPRGWSFQGAATHDPGCDHPGDYMSWQAQSPDGANGVAMLMGVQYATSPNAQSLQYMQSRGCVLYGSMAAQDFIRDVYLPKTMAGARVELAQAEADDFPALVQARRSLPQLEVNAGRVRVRYERDGRPLEAEIGALTACRRSAGPMPLMTCTVPILTTTWAPAGQLDAFQKQDAGNIKATPNPQYGERVAQLDAASAAQTRAGITANYNRNIAATRAFADNTINNIHAVGAASMAAARRSSDALHESSQAFARSMGDQAQFQGPGGQTFNASNQYRHTYVGPNGQVVQTNSAYGPGAGWTETTGR